MIWFKPFTVDDLNRMSENTLMARIGIEFTAFGDRHLEARMPVDKRTVQPAGILHGGASAALAETIASVGAYLTVDPNKKYCVGLELNANHLKSLREGWVYAHGKPLHMGKTTQVWGIEISNENGNLVCISRMTMIILEKNI